MTLTKKHLVESTCDRTGLTKVYAVHAIEALFEILKENIANGDDVLISGFGKFSVRGKSGRRGRNPRTGEDLALSPRKVVTFRCSSVLREKMNRK